jgi:scyllo-inositol 2-dehydrogenase (NADP+)
MHQIKTGIASFGMSGRVFHAPFIDQHPGFELTAIVERNKQDSRERYGYSTLLKSFSELLQREDIELIIVNTPIQTHHDYAKQALLAGKHVVVEKPFTVTADEAQELVDIAEEKNLQLFVYQNRRYDGDYRALKEILEQKLIGNIKEAELRFDRYRPEISYKVHKETDLPGAGSTYDLGAHLVDQALQLFGWPEALSADMMAMRDHSPVDDYFEIILMYPTFRVRLKGSCFVKQAVPDYILHGSLGSFHQLRSDLQEATLISGTVPSFADWCPGPSSPDGFLHTVIDGKED